MPVKAHKASDYLRSSEDAAAYLNAALGEVGDDPRLLMKALRNVVRGDLGCTRARGQDQQMRVATGVLNCTWDEKERLQTILETGFVDLYRRVNPVSDRGLNYGFNRRLPPTTRLQLVLGSESTADSVASARVDLEYRAPVDGLPGRTWPASAPVSVRLADPT